MMGSVARIIEKEVKNALLSKNKIIIVLGPRQVGKTTLINQILDDIDEASIRLNGEEQLIKDVDWTHLNLNSIIKYLKRPKRGQSSILIQYSRQSI